MDLVRGPVGLVIAIVACFAVAAAGGLATARSVGAWYTDLAKPAWTPPSWLFGPVWTVLYLTMAAALWLAVRQADDLGQASPTILLFGLQLLLNGLWSWLFFGFRQPGWAFAEIIALWLSILATAIAMGGLSPVSGWLMVPYLLWVGFATVLNGAIWRMNA